MAGPSPTPMPSDLRTAWAELVASWDATIERARALGEQLCQTQVRGEWSITQTLRHLVFATDAWFGRGIKHDPLPYHPAGLPPQFMDGIADMGIDEDAATTFDEAVDMWHGRSRLVSDHLANATADDLQAVCEPNEGLWPPLAEGTPAIHCLRVVFDETWAHQRFAARDLVILEAGGSDAR